MSGVFEHPRIRELLAASEEAGELAAAVKRRGKDPVDVEETLVELHRELGSQVHTWAREHLEVFPTAPQEAGSLLREALVLGVVEHNGDLPEPVEVEVEDEAEIEVEVEVDEGSAPPGFSVQFFNTGFAKEDEGRERWYDQESPRHDGPMFGPGDGLEERLPDDEDVEELDSQDTDEVELSYVRGLAGDTRDDTREEDTSEFPAWLISLGHLLDDLAMPTDPTGADALAVEAARVQWATVEPAARFGQYPEPLQLAVLGLLAARARHLADHLESDVGPRLALSRMRRYRKAAGLPPVVGLLSRREPESGSWSGDARHWWEVLVKGLRT